MGDMNLKDFECNTIGDLFANCDVLNSKWPNFLLDYLSRDVSFDETDEFGTLIIGGGLLGTFFASLVRAYSPKGTNLCIVDPLENLCDKFFNRCENLSLKYLRSGIDQHLSPDGLLSLPDFYLLQNDELDQVAWGQLRLSLQNNHIRDKVKEITKTRAGFIVTTINGRRLTAKSIVEAIGGVPRTLPTRHLNPGSVKNVYQGFEPLNVGDAKHVIVVGAGLTAGSRIVHLLDNSNVKITWIIRNQKAQIRCFDFPEEFLRFNACLTSAPMEQTSGIA